MKMRLSYILCFVWVLLTTTVWSQQKVANVAEALEGKYGCFMIGVKAGPKINILKITGIVKDTLENPVAGASVVIKAERNSVATNADGSFSLISLNKGKLLITVSAVGFREKEIRVERDSAINIILERLPVIRDECGYNPLRRGINSSKIYSGRVVDENHQAIPYATVKLSNNKKRVSADSLGNFLISIPHAATKRLEVSSVGYYPNVIMVTSGEVNTVILKAKETIYSSVTVVAGGWVRCKGFCGNRCPGRRCSRMNKIDTAKSIIEQSLLKNEDILSVYPNPVTKHSIINIRLKQMGDYSLRIIDNNGKLIQQAEFHITGKMNAYEYRLPSSAAGIHYVIVADKQSKKQYTEKLIIQ